MVKPSKGMFLLLLTMLALLLGALVIALAKLWGWWQS